MKKKWKIALGVLLGLCLLAAAGLIALLRSLPKDIAPFDDSALRRPVESLPDEKNAFAHYRLAAKAMQYPDDLDRYCDILEGKEWDSEFVCSVLEINAEFFDHVRRANLLERCLAPRVETFDAPMPYLAVWRSMARMYAIKADYHFREGQPGKAIEALGDMMRFASLCGAEPASRIQYRMSLALREIALFRARDMIRSGGFENRHLLRVIELLRDHEPSTREFVIALQTEYEIFGNLFEDMAAGNIPMDGGSPIMSFLGRFGARFFIHPNRTKRDMAMFVQEIIDQVDQPYAQMELTCPGEWSAPYLRIAGSNDWRAMLRTPNLAGSILVGMSIPLSRSIVLRKKKARVFHRATKLLAALHVFKNEHGRFPETLDELVPDILPAVPMDPYDGEPFRYSHEKGIVYSVGENLEDHGGSREPRPGMTPETMWQKRWWAEDIVFDVEGRGEDADDGEGE